MEYIDVFSQLLRITRRCEAELPGAVANYASFALCVAFPPLAPNPSITDVRFLTSTINLLQGWSINVNLGWAEVREVLT